MTKASIQAVAREAGVSVSTVSRTFAKPDLVLPETRDRVMTAAEKLDCLSLGRRTEVRPVVPHCAAGQRDHHHLVQCKHLRRP